MSEFSILKALVYESIMSNKLSDDKANAAAKKIIAAGFKLRDDDLEARVEKLERWMRGEF